MVNREMGEGGGEVGFGVGCWAGRGGGDKVGWD